jgi:hypothetical protein
LNQIIIRGNRRMTPDELLDWPARHRLDDCRVLDGWMLLDGLRP